MNTSGIALTLLAIAFFKSEGITEESGQTAIAVFASGVEDTLQTFACCAIAVTHCVRINVGVAVARLARFALASQTPFWVAEEAVATELAARSGVTDGAFQTDNCFIS